MKRRDKKKWGYAALAVIALTAVVVLIVWAAGRKGAQELPVPEAPTRSEEPDIRVVYKEKEVEKLVPVEVEKVITGDIVQDGLNDMGFLVTEEYWFTEVTSFSSVKSVLGIELSITESNFLVSYDGSVTAGVDFSSIEIAKDDVLMTVDVTVPAAVIRTVSIDNDTMKCYSEKNGVGNPISVEDFNQSLVTLKQGAEQKAVERGVLERADENAEKLIRDFVGGLVDLTQYRLTYRTV